MWHGTTVYGEQIRVPLILWPRTGAGRARPPGAGPAHRRHAHAAGAERPLLGTTGGGSVVLAAGGWKRRPVIAEKQPNRGDRDHPGAGESYAIMDGRWKLIQHVVRPPEKPEFELFDFYQDPLDQKDLAAANPEVVARLEPDSELVKGLSAEQLEQLRSLGYVK